MRFKCSVWCRSNQRDFDNEIKLVPRFEDEFQLLNKVYSRVCSATQKDERNSQMPRKLWGFRQQVCCLIENHTISKFHFSIFRILIMFNCYWTTKQNFVINIQLCYRDFVILHVKHLIHKSLEFWLKAKCHIQTGCTFIELQLIIRLAES